MMQSSDLKMSLVARPTTEKGEIAVDMISHDSFVTLKEKEQRSKGYQQQQKRNAKAKEASLRPPPRRIALEDEAMPLPTFASCIIIQT